MRNTIKSTDYVEVKSMNKPSAEDVGREFVKQYYTYLNKDPSQVHRFYSKDSIFFHGELANTCDNIPVVGQEAINRKIEQLNFIDCRVKIIHVDSQFTIGDNVVIQVCGEFSNNGEPTKKFIQTFVLAQETSTKYHVHNDIFRYQEERYDEVSDETGEGTIDSECDEQAVDEHLLENNEVNNDKLTSSNSEEDTSGLSDNDEDGKTLMVNGTTDAGYHLLTNEDELQEAELEEVVVEKIAPVQVPIDQKADTFFMNENHDTVVTVATDGTEPAVENHEIPNETCDTEKEDVAEVEEAEEQELVQNEQPEPEAEPEAEPETEPEPESTGTMSWAALASRGTKQSSNKTVRHEPKKPQPIIAAVTEVPKAPAGQRPREMTGNRSNNGQSVPNKDNTRLSGRNAPDNYQVFIGNLPNALGEQQVREVFSKYGKIVEVRLNPKNFGFVIFDSPEPAEAVLKDGTITIDGQEINIEEKKSTGFLGRGGRGGNAGSRGKSIMPNRGAMSGRGGPSGRGQSASGGGRGGSGQRGGVAGNGMTNRGRHNNRR